MQITLCMCVSLVATDQSATLYLEAKGGAALPRISEGGGGGGGKGIVILYSER